jgi:Leucine-rich repeat (LRR) protein
MEYWSGSIAKERVVDGLRPGAPGVPLTCPMAAKQLRCVTMGQRRYPTDWGSLTALTELDLGNNRLTVLAESLRNLTTLTSLDLGNNAKPHEITRCSCSARPLRTRTSSG